MMFRDTTFMAFSCVLAIFATLTPIHADEATPAHDVAKLSMLPPLSHQDVSLNMLVAHRGLFLFAPENTLLSMDLAVERGFRFLEIDVTTTQDDQFVVFHDQNTSRLGNDKPLCSIPYSDLRRERPSLLFFREIFGISAETLNQLRAYNDPWIEAIDGTYIPLLVDVFKRYGRSVYYHLDLKKET